jgi:DNA-binding beta-propeller fold protein YncE/mono/diheme cytochrome c family protein
MRRSYVLFPVLFAAACTSGLSESTFPTGSQTAVSTRDLASVLVVDEDHDAVSRVSVADGSVTSIPVGSRPERITRAGDNVYVTLRGEGAVARLVDDEGALRVAATVEVGAEPVGVVAREDGSRVYVALSQENAVVELDGSSLSELQRWAVEGQPSWLALHPSGEALFVASAMGGALTRIEVRTGTTGRVDLPSMTGAGTEGRDHLTPRLTGDPWISADGDTLAIPGLFVDHLTPAEDPDDGTEVVRSGYASSNAIVTSRFNPAVVVMDLDSTGGVASTGRAMFLAGRSPIKDGGEIVRSYPTSVAMAPRGDVAVVTMESSATAIVVSLVPLDDHGNPFADTGSSASRPLDDGFSMGAAVFTSMAAGPRGAVFLNDDVAWVDSFLDRSVRELDVAAARQEVNTRLASPDGDFDATMEGGAVHSGVTEPLDEELELGRKLFFSAVSSRMAADGSGVSCSTCHFDGRNDGLTWTFSDSVRQTPSLAAAVAETAPYTWTDGVDTVAAEALVTSQGRMGGKNLTTEDARAIEAFITSAPEVRVATSGVDTAAIERGRALFEGEQVGCADCHPAPLYTDNRNHDIYGLAGVNTPSLVGISASAPYLHNGSADSLRDVLLSAQDGAMGTTGSLSESELDDLEAFLRSI